MSVPEATDLFDRACVGDVDAYLQVVEPFKAGMRNVVYGMVRDAGTVDEVMQEVLLKGFRALPNFKRTASLKTWLYRIASNAAIDACRKQSRIATPTEDAQLLPLVDRQDVSETDDDFSDEVEAALARLSEQQRAIVLLVDGEGFTYQEAASALNISSGTIGFHVKRARKILLASLDVKERGVSDV